jgi:hypothetical protein
MTKTSLFAGLVLLFSAASANPIIIDGYTDRSSAFPGDSVGLHLHATAAYQDFTVNLFDLRGKIVHTNTIHVFPQKIQSRAFESGFGYIRSANVAVPYLPSGVYLWENKIPFIIKHPTPRIIVIYPSTTESAYNNAGGKSLYGFNSTDQKGATIVSFHRPAGIERFSEAFLRWMHTENNMEVGYIADIDMDRYAEIKKANLLIIPGHSEYWTLSARKNFDRFVENGNSAMVLSGNTMWWQVRYSDKRDKLICYRNIESDKGSPAKLKTINWNDPLLDYPILRSLGTDFSYAGYGAKVDKGWDGYKIIANSPLLVGTGIKVGDILPLRSQEADGAPLRGFQDGIPMLDLGGLKFFQAEIVGFDYTSRANKDGVMTWLVYRPTKSAGMVVNVASTNWCAENGIGSNESIQIITRNMIAKLLTRENIFSGEEIMTLVPIKT